MNSIKQFKLVTVILAIGFLSACVTVPSEIDVAKNANLVPFEKVSNSIVTVGPDAEGTSTQVDTGKKARWGGKIVSVVNKKDVSEIEVVFFPENKYGKPITSMPSVGRFKAVVEGFVDPLVFEQGRLITVVGEVGDGQTGIIGEQAYLYPTLNAMGYYMWKESTNINVELDTFGFMPFGYRSGFNHNFFNPWYDPWYRRHQRARIRIDKYNGHSQGGQIRQQTRGSQSNSGSASASRVDRLDATRVRNRTDKRQER